VLAGRPHRRLLMGLCRQRGGLMMLVQQQMPAWRLAVVARSSHEAPFVRARPASTRLQWRRHRHRLPNPTHHQALPTLLQARLLGQMRLLVLCCCR